MNLKKLVGIMEDNLGNFLCEKDVLKNENETLRKTLEQLSLAPNHSIWLLGGNLQQKRSRI